MTSKGSPSAESSSLDLNDNASQDAADMVKLGKKQQFRRQYGFWSVLGFACAIMSTWEGLLVTFIYGLANGGPAGLVYGYILIFLGMLASVASLAELMSMWPTSGGESSMRRSCMESADSWNLARTISLDLLISSTETRHIPELHMWLAKRYSLASTVYKRLLPRS